MTDTDLKELKPEAGIDRPVGASVTRFTWKGLIALGIVGCYLAALVDKISALTTMARESVMDFARCWFRPPDLITNHSTIKNRGGPPSLVVSVFGRGKSQIALAPSSGGLPDLT